MAILNPPSYMEAGDYSAREDRLLTDTLVPIPGVVDGMDVSQQTTANMSVRVSAGRAFVKYTASSDQGTYHVVNDGFVTLAIASAHATLTRIDRVVLTVRDATLAGGLNNDAIFQVITGTPASSPSAPAQPANSITLAVITISPGVSSIVTAKINGAPARIKNIARMSYSLAPQAIACLSTARPTQNLVDGMVIYETDTGFARYRVGSQWKYLSGDFNAAVLTDVIQTELAGWDVTAADASIRGGTLQVAIAFSRTGAAITVPSTGNITNSQICTIKPEYRPYFNAAASSTSVGRAASGYCTPAGGFYLTAVAPGANISTGEAFSMGFTGAMSSTLYQVS